MKHHGLRLAVVVAAAALACTGIGATTRTAAATLPAGNTVEQWDRIAEDTVVGSGAFQSEGFVYMAYVTTAIYDAAVSLAGGYQSVEPAFRAWKKASPDAAVVEAAYRTLTHFFPAASGTLDGFYAQALAAIPDGPAKLAGEKIGAVAASQVIRARNGDGLTTPIAATSSFPALPAGPGVWRLTPSAFATPQTPWVGNVRPFILKSAKQFLPAPPPALSSAVWVAGYNETKTLGGATSTVRTDEQTAIAKFWSANVVRQYNRVVRDITDARALGLLETARLAAMVNVVATDAQISVMYAKYHYLFWRPVTAIDRTAVTSDGFGPVPGYDDGNASTEAEVGWRPLLATPNHPEYPSAHGSLTSAMTEVFAAFLGSSRINLDIHGFDAAGPAGNLDAVRHFDSAADLTTEIVNARIWAGLHYRFSCEAAVQLGTHVARYDLAHMFRTTR